MKLKMISVLTIVMLFAAFGLKPVQADNETQTRLYVDPPLSFAFQGETFTVDLKVSDVEFLYAWQANVTFNPAVLEFVDVTEREFLKDTLKEQCFYRDWRMLKMAGYLLV